MFYEGPFHAFALVTSGSIVWGILPTMRGLHLILLCLFVSCEDFRLGLAPVVLYDCLVDFTAYSWGEGGLLHLSTSPVLALGGEGGG